MTVLVVLRFEVYICALVWRVKTTQRVSDDSLNEYLKSIDAEIEHKVHHTWLLAQRIGRTTTTQQRTWSARKPRLN